MNSALHPAVNAETRRRHAAEAGFTLIELLIVMSIILILATLAIPAMQKTIIKANETSAIASLKDLTAQENSYNSSYPTHGFACSLPQLGGKSDAGTPTPDAAQLIPEDLASGHKSGFTFTVTCGGKTTINNQDQFNSYTINAVPNSVGHSGNRGFCTDEDGQIRFDPKGGTNCVELLQ